MIHTNKKMRKITLIKGTMFAGKTTLLLRMYQNSINSGFNCILFKPNIDIRYGKDTIHTHDKNFCFKAINIDTNNPYFDILNNIKNKNIQKIFIDEISLFNKDLFIAIGKLSLNYDLILAGLETNFKGDYFYNTKEVSNISSEIINVYSVCDCGNIAYYNQKKIQNDELIEIGENNLYQVKCKKCFLKN